MLIDFLACLILRSDVDVFVQVDYLLSGLLIALRCSFMKPVYAGKQLQPLAFGENALDNSSRFLDLSF